MGKNHFLALCLQQSLLVILHLLLFQAENLHELFFKLRDSNKQTFIIVTHNDKLADLADKKITIKDGRIF